MLHILGLDIGLFFWEYWFREMGVNVQYGLCIPLLWKADGMGDSYFFYFNGFQLHWASYVCYKYHSPEEKS